MVSVKSLNSEYVDDAETVAAMDSECPICRSPITMAAALRAFN